MERHLYMDDSFIPLEKQVMLLQDRGLIVDERTKWILEREGYDAVITRYEAPFLVRNAGAGEIRFREGATFSQIHALFSFDRKLRQCVIEMLELAESLLKNVCAYQFTAAHSGEREPYLELGNYNPNDVVLAKSVVGYFTQMLRSAQKVAAEPTPNGRFSVPSHLVRCMREYPGGVPLRMLIGILTFGQIVNFYSVLPIEIRAKVSASYTALYNDAHKNNLEKSIPPRKLEKIYQRMKEYRNICAHNGQLYCAYPGDANATVLQLLEDLQLVIDKQRYLEFLQKFRVLVIDLKKHVPSYCYDEVVSKMGFDTSIGFLTQFTEFQHQMQKS